MILHLLTDSKFSEYVFQQFNRPELLSDFIIVSESKQLVHIDVEGLNHISIVSPNTIELDSVVNKIMDYRAIILHGLFWPWEEYLLKKKPQGVKVAWMFWGGEIYGRRDLQFLFLAPKTKCLLYLQQIKRFLMHRRLQSLSYEIPISLFSQVDYCLTDIEEEYVFASNYLSHKMGFLWYNYYSIEETLGSLYECQVEGNNLLIDNSGTISGNHLDIFQRLRRIDFQGRKVIVPLCYGDPWLINRLIKEGEKTFKFSFTPLTSFVPREQYNRILASCSAVIMNHYRPQALGNIITALWIGSRVFMSERSIQYKYFKTKGIVLFSIEKELSLLYDSNGTLSPEDIQRNRQILCSIYSKKEMNRKIIDLVSVLNS